MGLEFKHNLKPANKFEQNIKTIKRDRSQYTKDQAYKQKKINNLISWSSRVSAQWTVSEWFLTIHQWKHWIIPWGEKVLEQVCKRKRLKTKWATYILRCSFANAVWIESASRASSKSIALSDAENAYLWNTTLKKLFCKCVCINQVSVRYKYFFLLSRSCQELNIYLTWCLVHSGEKK